MANKRRIQFPVTLDKPRTFRLTYNTLCEAETAAGTSLLSGRLGFNEIRAVLWAGLKHEDMKLTIARVGTLIENSDNIADIGLLVGKAVSEFFKDDGDDEEDAALPEEEVEGNVSKGASPGGEG